MNFAFSLFIIKSILPLLTCKDKKVENNIDEALELEKLKKARKERKKNATVEV